MVNHFSPTTYGTHFTELATFAALRWDPRADLPAAFTLCSANSAPAMLIGQQSFFTLLGADETPFLSTVMLSNRPEEKMS